MVGAVFPPCYLTWGQTMVEVMKIMVTSFKRSHAGIVRLSAPKPAAGHLQYTPLPEAPGHSRARLGQSLVGSLLLSLGSWCTQGFVCALQGLFPQSSGSSGGSMVGLMVTSSKRVYAVPRSAAPRAPAPAADQCWPITPQETLKHSASQFLWGLWVLMHKRLFEPSERLWRVWGLILNVISPLLPSCWSVSFALGHGVSPQSHSSTVQPPLLHLPASWEICMQVRKQQ